MRWAVLFAVIRVLFCSNTRAVLAALLNCRQISVYAKSVGSVRCSVYYTVRYLDTE